MWAKFFLGIFLGWSYLLLGYVYIAVIPGHVSEGLAEIYSSRGESILVVAGVLCIVSVLLLTFRVVWSRSRLLGKYHVDVLMAFISLVLVSFSSGIFVVPGLPG